MRFLNQLLFFAFTIAFSKGRIVGNTAFVFSPYSSIYSGRQQILQKSTVLKKTVGITMEIIRGRQEKIGTGENGMTNTGFMAPFVEKIALPGTTQEFEWRVKSSILDQKKMSIPEKVKMTKPPLALLEEIDMLAEEAREAERIQQEQGIPPSICTSHETRLKWLGLFHRGKIAPGTYMWRFRFPNGIMKSHQVGYIHFLSRIPSGYAVCMLEERGIIIS
jgi:hypothetical protein